MRAIRLIMKLRAEWAEERRAFKALQKQFNDMVDDARMRLRRLYQRNAELQQMVTDGVELLHATEGDTFRVVNVLEPGLPGG